jgi:hypothetical protein
MNDCGKGNGNSVTETVEASERLRDINNTKRKRQRKEKGTSTTIANYFAISIFGMSRAEFSNGTSTLVRS